LLQTLDSEDAVNWSIQTLSMYGVENADIIYTNLPYLLPLPLVECTISPAVIPTTDQASTACSTKVKKLNRIRLMGDLFDSEASSDAFPDPPPHTSSEQDTKPQVSIPEKEEQEEPAQRKVTLESLSALANMYDTFSSLDTLRTSNFLQEGSCDVDRIRSGLVCPGSTDKYRTCEEVNLKHQLAFAEQKSTVEILTLKHTQSRLKTVMDKHEELPKCDKFDEKISWPVENPCQDSLSLDQCGIQTRRYIIIRI
jgi:hypothetical protein